MIAGISAVAKLRQSPCYKLGLWLCVACAALAYNVKNMKCTGLKAVSYPDARK